MARDAGRKPPEISSGSMADIAFLLLIFFLVTTTIANDKGIALLLPPRDDQMEEKDVDIQQRNIFKILANSKDQLLVEDEPWRKGPEVLKEEVKKFILNFGSPSEEAIAVFNSFPPSLKNFVNQYGRRPNSSDEPMGTKAVVSFKANRGTSYELYIEVLDAINGAYNEIYGERVGLSPDEFLALDKGEPSQKAIYDRAREGIPRAISIAEPE